MRPLQAVTSFRDMDAASKLMEFGRRAKPLDFAAPNAQAFSPNTTALGRASSGVVLTPFKPPDLSRPQVQPATHPGRGRTETALPTPLRRHFYAHGGYMGLAKSLLDDAQWSVILTKLMPTIAVQAGDLWRRGEVGALMALLENNPVLAAYGALRNRRQSLPLEWDVWLDPTAPGDLHRARIIHGNTAAALLTLRNASLDQAQALLQRSVCGSDVHHGDTAADWLEHYAAALAQAGNRTLSSRPRSLYLDIKSTWSGSQDVQCFVDSLGKRGMTVLGVGSFRYAQIKDVRVGRRLAFVHGAVGVGLEVAAGTVPPGSAMLFNGGTLLMRHSEGGWCVRPAALDDLRAQKRAADLHLGIYIQEPAACPQAVAALVDCVNQHPELFDLGFAYGAPGDVAESAVGQGTGTGAQRLAVLGETIRRYGWRRP